MCYVFFDFFVFFLIFVVVVVLLPPAAASSSSSSAGPVGGDLSFPDLVGGLVHESLQRIVEGDHEVGMMDRRLSSREDGGERLVSVSQNIRVLVAFPNVEDFGDIEIVGIFVFLAKILHEGTLESDFVVTVLVGLLFLEPLLGIGDHHFVISWMSPMMTFR